MAEIKVVPQAETPSSQVVSSAMKEFSVIDARSRIIGLRKPSVLFQYRLVELVGDSAKNEVYMTMILPIVYVCSIDGELVAQPATKRELEALIQRLDEDGINAVMEGVTQHFGGKQDAEGQKDALKK